MFSTTFFLLILSPVLWGIAENRLFNCNSNQAIFPNSKFRVSKYHVWLFVFFSVYNIAFALVSSTQLYSQVLVFSFLSLYNILVLDVVWWSIRWIHFSFYGVEVASKMYFGETNKWHLQTDFDSAGLPLWRGTYCWWYILTFTLLIIGVVWCLL